MTVDNDTPINQLTVGELRDVLELTDERANLKELTDKYQEMLSGAKPMEAASQAVFADVEQLIAVTSPFRISSIEGYNKLKETMEAALSIDGQYVLVSMAIVGGDKAEGIPKPK